MIKYCLLAIFFLNTLHLFGQETEPRDTVIRGSMQIKADYRIDQLMERYKKQNEGKQISGYRIQLFSGDRKGAFDLKANFIKQFDSIPCNVVYEAPDFKVQVGNYRTQLEAERDMQFVWPVFKSAFVVRTLIDLPKLRIEAKED